MTRDELRDGYNGLCGTYTIPSSTSIWVGSLLGADSIHGSCNAYWCLPPWTKRKSQLFEVSCVAFWLFSSADDEVPDRKRVRLRLRRGWRLCFAIDLIRASASSCVVKFLSLPPARNVP